MRICLGLVVLFSLSSVSGYCAEKEQKTFSSAGLNRLYVTTETGAITVDGTSRNTVLVEISGNEQDKCILTMNVAAGRLVLTAEGRSYTPPKGWKNIFGLFRGGERRVDCPASFNVSAPSFLELEAKAGTGDVNVAAMSAHSSIEAGTGDILLRGISGSLAVQNGTGALTGSACPKNMVIKGGTGKIQITGLCGPAIVQSGGGGVNLEWDRVPSEGDVRIQTGTGSVRLVFPDAAKLSTSLSSGLGRITNEFENSNGFPVSVQSGTGSVSVIKSKGNKTL